MSEGNANVEFKLSPLATVALIIVLAIGAGVVYMVKPELFSKYISQATSGKVDTLPKDSYYSKIEESLKLRLQAELLTTLAARQAPQAEYDAIKEIKITSITAEPIGYFKNERAFWKASDLRQVDIKLSFTAGGKKYKATGDFTVSGVSDHIALGSVTVQR